MREIKFRGKRVDNGEWVYGYFAIDKDTKSNCIIERIYWDCEGCSDQALYYEVDPNTIGQYTGLKDKNSKEIYEGDIYHQGDRNILYVVEYTHDCSFMGRQIRTKGSRVGLAYWQDRIEVIGNIYDNPELLGVKE